MTFHKTKGNPDAKLECLLDTKHNYNPGEVSPKFSLFGNNIFWKILFVHILILKYFCYRDIPVQSLGSF